MKFRLYDSGGNPQGSPDAVTLDGPGVQVTNGIFIVRPHSADPNLPAYTTLSPRQQITSTPYAIRSTSAGSADTATTAANLSGSLSGDVTGTQGATAVASVGGVCAANVASGATAANGATDANTAGAVVRRDGSGNFSAGTITLGSQLADGASINVNFLLGIQQTGTSRFLLIIEALP